MPKLPVKIILTLDSMLKIFGDNSNVREEDLSIGLVEVYNTLRRISHEKINNSSVTNGSTKFIGSESSESGLPL
jgi:hypothetical protein